MTKLEVLNIINSFENKYSSVYNEIPIVIVKTAKQNFSSFDYVVYY